MNRRLAISLVALFGFLAFVGGYVVFVIQTDEQKSKEQLLQKEAADMRENIQTRIYAKQKATVAIALALSHDKMLPEYMSQKAIPSDYAHTITQELRENTLYKNIWIHIVDANLTSMYRSWTPEKGDSLRGLRNDLQRVLETQKVSSGISSSRYDLSIKAMVPIFYHKKLVGVLEVISHFNSIANALQKEKIASAVVLKPEYAQHVIHPFTHLFIDDWYIANYNVQKKMLQQLRKEGIEKYLNRKVYKTHKTLYTFISMKCVCGKEVGYFIAGKELSDISFAEIDFSFFKLLATLGFAFMVVAGVLNLSILYYVRKQKKYYESIIDSSTNIILVNNKQRILDVNSTFFEYFNMYDNLEVFYQEHQCICEFFEEEVGYLAREMEGENWVEYLLQNPHKRHVAKFRIGEEIFYFQISASVIGGEKYSIIFTNITEREQYKRTLESMSVTDPLTQIGNRRFYQQKLASEIARAARYEHPLSLIMFDIDFFKKINDTYGHDVGDNVLKEHTKLIKKDLREGDIFCRIGGEEFVVILPHVDLSHATALAEKLRVLVKEHNYDVKITMSFGVVSYVRGESEESIYKRADGALYEAKAQGRDRVVAR